MATFWSYRKDLPLAKASRLPQLTQDLGGILHPRRGPRGTSHRALSKQSRDRARFTERNQRQTERMRLFGYVKLKNGETISLDEALRRLQDGMRVTPRTGNSIQQNDIEVWCEPESFTDCLNSIGEVDALTNYPALAVEEGTVLRDPKLRHVDAALREW